MSTATGRLQSLRVIQQWELPAIGRQNLRWVERPVPELGPEDLLIETQAVSLNYRELLILDARYGADVPLPLVPGSDLAGRVCAVGRAVRGWAVGDRVISTFTPGWLDGAVAPAESRPLGAGHAPGVLASHVRLPAHAVVAAPRSLDAAGASTLPCAGLTAWTALVERGHVQAGDQVLVHGSGGVALFGVQLARLHGAQPLVVSGSASKQAAIEALGARVVARQGDWPAQVRALTGGRGVDHVLETVGGANLGRSLEALADGGEVGLIGVLEGTDFSGSAFQAIRRQARIHGIGVGHRRSLQALVRAVDASGLKPVIAAEYPAQDLQAALDHLAGGPLGKVVVRFAQG